MTTKRRTLLQYAVISFFVCTTHAFGTIFRNAQTSPFVKADSKRMGCGRDSKNLPMHQLNSKKLSEDDQMKGGVEEYRNEVTKLLANFMRKEKSVEDDPLGSIDFQVPRINKKVSLETLATALDCELIEREWFVTGNVKPFYFSENFEFVDPDVQVKGIEEYARGVHKLFDQSTSRAEILSTVWNETASTPEKPVITCTWRLSGGVNIGFGLPIKPYIVYTDFVIDPETSQILFQEDRFDLPSWDILLSSLFPFLIGVITKPEAPPVPKRQVTMPKL